MIKKRRAGIKSGDVFGFLGCIGLSVRDGEVVHPVAL